MKHQMAFRYLTLAFVLLLALIIYWASRGAMPRALAMLYGFPGGDKVGHLVLMGILAFLVNMSLAGRRAAVGGQHVLVGSLLVAVAITIEEASQLLVRQRTFSLVDLGLGYLGIWLCRYPVSRLCDRYPKSGFSAALLASEGEDSSALPDQRRR